jgi:hypothetical protein
MMMVWENESERHSEAAKESYQERRRGLFLEFKKGYPKNQNEAEREFIEKRRTVFQQKLGSQ